ncbi:U-scoloptoxin(16)-Ssd1a-like [Eriocheir sinensis]|uniref:U-scoloptoxin(16)-Ssd1a-like n=1 Tax=Eriocheir sinensis TaxID=95602 RepID=UPI0021C89251|nr:U-scoloptoxin(16)-Ssd1a-like [Eriocheir sinensis]
MGMLRTVLLAETVLVLLVLLPQARAAVGLSEANHPDYPGQCYVEGSGAVNEGHTWNMPNCVQATCVKHSGNNMVVQMFSCGVAIPAPGCIIHKDESASYPDCCGKEFCPT